MWDEVCVCVCCSTGSQVQKPSRREIRLSHRNAELVLWTHTPTHMVCSLWTPCEFFALDTCLNENPSWSRALSQEQHIPAACLHTACSRHVDIQHDVNPMDYTAVEWVFSNLFLHQKWERDTVRHEFIVRLIILGLALNGVIKIVFHQNEHTVWE